MKNKVSVFKRVLSLLLVMMMLVTNLPVPAHAVGTAAPPGCGIDYYAYTYDAERTKMMNHSAFLALKYLGYDKDEVMGNAGTLFDLTRDKVAKDYRTIIPYSESPNTSGRQQVKNYPSKYLDLDSFTGYYPNVGIFEKGYDATEPPGLDCADYVAYYVTNFLPNMTGADITILSDAQAKIRETKFITYDYMNFWPDAMEYVLDDKYDHEDGSDAAIVWSVDPEALTATSFIDENGVERERLVINGYTMHTGINESKYYTDNIYDHLPIGAIIQMGEPVDLNNDDKIGGDLIHYAIYAGTYNGRHYIYHCGNSRGPEIAEVEDMWSYSSINKQSYPVNFYYFSFMGEYEDYGSIEVYKTDEDGNPLAGAKFEVKKPDGTLTFVDTDKTGYARLTELPLGTYTVRELIPPVGYEKVDTVWTITLTKKDPTGGGTIHVTNKQLKGSLKIQKLILPTSMSTPENLAGWKFEVKDKKGMTVGTYTTGTEGFVQVNDLPIGTYYVQEDDTDGKKGWEYDTEQKTVEVTAGHTAEAPAVVSFSNQYLNGGLQIKKITEDSKYPAGWQFGVYAEPGCSESSRMDTASTDPQGIATFSSLPAGTYWVKELGHTSPTVNELYHCASDNPQKVTVAAGATATVEFRNDLNRGDIEIIKEGDDEEKTKLPGATFAIFDANGNALTITDPDGNGFSSFTDNGDGTYSMKGLPYGTYIVKEIAPPAGYNLGAVTEWTITVGSQTLVDGKVTFTVQNTKEVGDLALQKVTEDGKNKEGWLFAVYADADCTNMVAGPKATDGEGKLTFTKLAPGEYWVKELGHENSDIEALYYCNGEKVQKVTIEDGKTAAVEFENKLNRGDIVIIKKDENGKLLVGAVFQAVCNGTMYSFTDNGDGTYSLLNVPYGKYTVEETQAPDGYKFGSETTWVVELNASCPNDTYSFEVVNDQLKGGLTIQKETEDGKNKEGWLFNIYADEAKTQLLFQKESDQDGYIIMEGLTPGTYWVEEVGHKDADINALYFCDGAKTQKVTVEYSKAATVKFLNKLNCGDLALQKVTENGLNKAGWLFAVYSDAACANLVEGPKATDGEGKLTFATLISGEYWVKELGHEDPKIEALYYCNGDEVRKITIETGKTATVEFENKLNRGSIEITKKGDDGKLLSGASFSILDADGNPLTIVDVNGNPFTFTDNGDGTYSVFGLPYGTYTVEETAAPEGYTFGSETTWVVELNASCPNDTYSFEVVNDQLKGGLNIQKDTEDGRNKGGWLFNIYGDEAKTQLLYEKKETDANGRINVSDLTPGTYWVEEVGHKDANINALYYCDGSKVQKVTIAYSEAATVTFLNKLYRGSIEITKKGDDDKLLSGAEFKAVDAYGKEYFFTDNGDGTYSLLNVPYGTYIITEVKAPNGYKIGDENEWFVTLSQYSPNAQESVTIVNVKLQGGLSIRKDTEDGLFIEGWIFEIYADQNMTDLLYENLQTDENGYIIVPDLTPGTVWVYEVGHPEQYINDRYYCVGDNPKAVEIFDGGAATVEFENKMGRGAIEIYKTDEEGKPLAGAEFYALDSMDVRYDFVDCGNGYYRLENIPFDTYRVYEASPPDGYKLGDEAYWPVVLGPDSYEAKESFTVINYKEDGYLSLQKKTEDNKNLAGWIFEIYSDEACTNLIKGNLITNNKGYISEDISLAPGTYWVKEAGNTNPEITEMYTCRGQNPRKVTITSGQTNYVTFINDLAHGKLEIHKETNTGDRKEGWKFHVFSVDANGVRTEITGSPFTTPAEGVLLIENLTPGTYVVTEEGSSSAYWTCDVTAKETLVKAGQTTDPLVFTNVVKGKLQIKKTTTDGSSAAGYLFNVYDPDGNLLENSPFTSGGDGSIDIGYVLPGLYTVEEVLADDSPYYVVGNARQTLEVKPEEVTTFTFTNAPKLGTLEIWKETNTGKDKDGWKVNIYRGSVSEENLLPGSPFTTEDGKIVVTDLPIGTYIVVEVDDGKEMWVYDLEEKTATVPFNGTASVTIRNTQLGYGQIKKETTNGGIKAGWLFELRNAAGDLVGTYETDSNGEYLAKDLLPGSYTVTEIGHKTMTQEQLAYWIMDAESTKELVVEAGATASVTFTNQWRGKGTLTKYSSNNGTTAGWQFKLYTADMIELDIFTTNDHGEIDFGLLDPGTYYVKEIGHVSMSEEELSYWDISSAFLQMTIEAGTTDYITADNDWLGKGAIVKTTTNGGIKAGWLFHIWSDTADFGIQTTDKNGHIDLGLLDPGTYYIQEVGHESEDLTYWVMDTEVKELVVEAGKTSGVSFENRLLGKGEIQKDTTNSTTKAGWQFEIWTSDKNLGIFTTNEYGMIDLGLQEPGTYFIREIGHVSEDLTYWVMDTEIKRLTIVAGEIRSVSFENVLQGKGEIQKTTNTGGTLEGWQFHVWNSTKDFGTFTTNEYGHINLGLLDPGTYSIQEIGHATMTEEQLAFWTMDKTIKEIVIEPGKTTEVSIRNTHSGDFLLEKETTDNSSAEGWRFDITDSEGNTVTYYTDKDGKIQISLLPGTYTITEVIPADVMYEPTVSYSHTIEVKPGQINVLTQVNKPIQGDITITKTDGKGNKLSQAGFIAEDSKGNTYNFVESATEPGVYVITNIPIDKYIISEIMAPPGFQISNDKWTVTLSKDNRSEELEIINSEMGKGKIVKKTVNSGLLAGWLFEVKDAAGNPLKNSPYATDIYGEIDLGYLMPGTYTIREIGHESEDLTNWILDTEEKTIVIESGKTSAVTFTNTKLSKLLVQKSAVNSTVIEGWMFDIYVVNADGTETKIGSHTTNNSGQFDLLVAPGKYIIRETGHTDTSMDLSYWAMSDSTEVQVSADTDASVTITNTLLGKLRIEKKAVNSNLLSGWTGDLYRVNGDNTETKVGTYTSDADGLFADLVVAPGKYIFRETGHSDASVDLTYWVMASDVEAQVSAGNNTTATITNKQHGKGQLIKKMADGTSPVGYQFKVVGPDGTELPGSPFTITNENGTFFLGDLEPGTYTVTELLPDNSIYDCVGGTEKTLTVNAGETTSVTFVNTLRGGEITVNKLDGTTGTALAGAKFLLEWLNNGEWMPVVYSETVIPGGCSNLELENGCLTTGEDGRITFRGLYPDCEYRLTEIEAPNGYSLQAASVFEGKLPADTLSFEENVINYRIIVLPSTGIVEDMMPLAIFSVSVVSLFFVLLAIAVKNGLLMELRKKNRK